MRTGGALARVLALAALALASLPGWAHAAGSPFGVGLPDGGRLPGAEHAPGLFLWFIALQGWFSQHLAAALRGVRTDGAAAWTLVGLSFLYGVLHAIGPGHGKAVVASYVAATRQTLRDGVVLAFAASMAQAAGAVAIVLVAYALLGLTSVAVTRATVQFELVSNALIVGLGLWLVWRKILLPVLSPARGSLNLAFQPVTALTRPHAFAGAVAAGGGFQAVAVGETQAARGRSLRRASTALAEEDCDCGVIHGPAAAAGGGLDWRKAWTVVASTALRPCTGALIVQVLALSQGLLWAGVLSALVMGVGTALTVAALAALTVSARGAAFFVARGDTPAGRRVLRIVESVGALAVLALGVALLAADLLG